MSIGSETVGGVRNVTVKNCTFESTENGIRIKSTRGRGGIVENLVCDGITMKDVNPAITFTCFYANNSAGDTAPPAAVDEATRIAEKIPVFRHIRISNLTATCPKEAGIIAGLPESCITDVVLDNVKITAATGFIIQNANNIKLTNSSVVAKKGPAILAENAQVEGLETPK